MCVWGQVARNQDQIMPLPMDSNGGGTIFEFDSIMQHAMGKPLIDRDGTGSAPLNWRSYEHRVDAVHEMRYICGRSELL